MLLKWTVGTRRFNSTCVVALALLSSAVGAQGQRSDAGGEDIVILRSLRLSRIAPTGFCAASRTGFTEEYVGGQLTTNTLQLRTTLGSDTDPPGYTQPSIATIRLWKKR